MKPYSTDLHNIRNQYRRPMGRNKESSTMSKFIMFCLFGTLALAFFAGGAYLGIVTMLVGGVVQIIEASKMDPVNASMVGWGIAKCVFCEVPIIVGFWLAMLTGAIAVGVSD